MKINVKRIPADGERLQGTEAASVIELEEEDVRFEHEIEYNFLAQVQGKALLVMGRLSTPATLRCSRCRRMFEVRIQVNEFAFHQELCGEDFVDLTPNIREDIILVLPQRALCKDECKGLCWQCGQDLNEGNCLCEASKEDSRWHMLDDINIRNREKPLHGCS